MDTLKDVVRRTHPTVLDVHDDPIAQLAALGVDPGEARRQELVERAARNRDAFEWLLAPTASFANLAGLPPERTIVAPNGTDTTTITPRPLPDRPAIGFASGAAAGRGIELLVEAARIVREGQPDLQLLLWLVATGSDSHAYLEGLRARLADEAWIEIGSAPYDRMADELGRASVIVIPHPPGDYLDVRAADQAPRRDGGRPARRRDASDPDGPRRPRRRAAVSWPATAPTASQPRCRGSSITRRSGAELGANGRRVAEAEYDWRVIGDAVARRILQPPG